MKRELTKEKRATCDLIDIESGKTLTPHGGTVYWNDYRNKWIMIAVQQGGTTSYLGEVWYTEADTPAGPWRYARKVVTHDAYSFYNPKHHPYFDQAQGRHIYFEGTYTHTFSGSKEQATPRYDYNQIMYRLDLADPRLSLPEPVYRIRTGRDQISYGPACAIDHEKNVSAIEAIAFYAMAPDRAAGGLVAVYENTDDKGRSMLTAIRPAPTAKPLFFGLKVDSDADTQKAAIELFEYRHRTTDQKCYSTEILDPAVWDKNQKALCRVWQGPSEVVLADWQVRPANH